MERSLCSALGQYIHLEISNSNYSKYHVDVEYNRNKGHMKTIYNADLKVVSILCNLIVYSGEKL